MRREGSGRQILVLKLEVGGGRGMGRGMGRGIGRGLKAAERRMRVAGACALMVAGEACWELEYWNEVR